MIPALALEPLPIRSKQCWRAGPVESVTVPKLHLPPRGLSQRFAIG